MKEVSEGFKIYKGLILNDYPDKHYAQWVKEGKKKIETRMNRLFSYRGDIIICCGETNSVTANAGKALCIVEIFDGRSMTESDEKDACIEWHPDRKSLLLRNWRHFSRDFTFKKHKVSGSFQSIFELTIPDDVQIIPQPQITHADYLQYTEKLNV